MGDVYAEHCAGRNDQHPAIKQLANRNVPNAIRMRLMARCADPFPVCYSLSAGDRFGQEAPTIAGCLPALVMT